MQRHKISQVGYKRPPVESRFKKGQSGNPQGRRRAAPATIAAMVAEELQATVVISENGRRLKVQKMRVLAKEAIKQAMKGHFQPLVLMTKMSHALERLNGTATRKDPATDRLEEDEFSKLSDDELEEDLRQRYAKLFPKRRKSNSRR
jgi:hypothetical protein